MNRFSGKVAIVTGSSSGIGRASATMLAREGAKVAVVDVNSTGGEATVKTIKDAGGEAMFVRADITNPEDVKQMAAQVSQKYGQINVLHNNAGGWKREFHDTVTEDTENDWRKLVDLNLTSVYFVSSAVIPHMIKSGGGSIVNTVTINAFMGQRDTAAYSAAKAGVYQLTRAMALDYAEYKIRVNGVAPGEVVTPQWTATFNSLPDPEKSKELLLKKIPLGRLAEPEDIGEVVVWLASNDSRYITGQVIVVDGGLTAGYYNYV
jgi:NAD(P)-dependent dehydrogenase (short-subunit alcohol dehydrogenase family)